MENKKSQNNNDLTLFEWKRIRRIYDEKKETWFFSLIDIIAVLTEQEDYKKAQSYWTTLKSRLKKEWSQVVTNCDKLKLLASDWKRYNTDVADIETILRLIQSVPSKKAEPIKLWLAKVGNERMQEITDPEKSIDRARENWQKLWRSEKWITWRMSGQETRNKLTDYWSENGIEKWMEFAILTNIIHSEWTWLSVKEHKNLKNLKSQNLRDHMTEAELIFTSLAELSTRQIAETTNAKWLKENKQSAKKWWNIAKNAKKELEEKTWKSIISWESFLESKKRIE
jgi:hypothetical protein